MSVLTSLRVATTSIPLAASALSSRSHSSSDGGASPCAVTCCASRAKSTGRPCTSAVSRWPLTVEGRMALPLTCVSAICSMLSFWPCWKRRHDASHTGGFLPAGGTASFHGAAGVYVSGGSCIGAPPWLAPAADAPPWEAAGPWDAPPATSAWAVRQRWISSMSALAPWAVMRAPRARSDSLSVGLVWQIFMTRWSASTEAGAMRSRAASAVRHCISCR
mmetsp:Transcript_48627/g.156357  ORF Transcript_48627/g.156357 Transcript_48627/m.156357 type:complete len:219 (-) Transcript_48627:2018-2674(-)